MRADWYDSTAPSRQVSRQRERLDKKDTRRHPRADLWTPEMRLPRWFSKPPMNGKRECERRMRQAA